MKKAKGRITSWNDDKGYGFISAMIGDERTFVHIRAFKNRTRRPIVGDSVTYSIASDRQGRPRAEDVSIAGMKPAAKPKRSSNAPSYLVTAGFLLVVGFTVLVSALPISVLLIYLAVSIVTFLTYVRDKSAAETGGWRTSEITLHLLALAGGWPGALIAQDTVRHKSRKQPFRAVFWTTVVFNCVGFLWLLNSEGAEVLTSVLP